MRSLEIVLLLVNLPLVAYALFAREQTPYGRLAPVVAVVVCMLHLWFDGYRWQIAPAYLATAFLFASCTWPRVPTIGAGTGLMVLVFLIAAGVMGTVLPVFQFPEPTGTFRIGSVTRHFVDHARNETEGDAHGKNRELMVQIWYPADRTGTQQFYRTETPATLRNEHLRLVKLHSYSGVPVSSSRSQYPVLLFSPAWTGNCNQYTFLAEELASHGFIVVGIDHPYGSETTVFPDGRIIKTVFHNWLDYGSDEALEASIQLAESQLRVRTADLQFTLSELVRLNAKDPTELLTGRLDMSRVGAFGHSFGGAVAAEVCHVDGRFKAGINLDGMPFGASAVNGVGKPFMFMLDDEPIPTSADVANSEGQRRRYLDTLAKTHCSIRQSLANHGGFIVTIQGARHQNFTDGPLYTPIKGITRAGVIDQRRALAIIKDYGLAFFRANLNGTHEPLLDAPSAAHSEVQFECFAKSKG